MGLIWLEFDADNFLHMDHVCLGDICIISVHYAIRFHVYRRLRELELPGATALRREELDSSLGSARSPGHSSHDVNEDLFDL